MGREEIPRDGSSPSVIANADRETAHSSHADVTRQNAWSWTIVGIVIVILASIAVLAFIWSRRSVETALPPLSPPSHPTHSPSRSTEHKDVGPVIREVDGAMHFHDSVQFDRPIVAGSWTGPPSTTAPSSSHHRPEPTHPIHLLSRARFHRGFELPCHLSTLTNFRVRSPGIFTCKNNGAVTVTLPSARTSPGWLIWIQNKTGRPQLTVQCTGIDSIQQAGQQSVLVTYASLFVSDGDDRWMLLE